jgi:hypothetical protein
MDMEWALLNGANNYRTLPNNESWSVNKRRFGGEWAYLSLLFHPISELCTHGPALKSVLNVLQGVKVLVFLYFVVAQRAERELFETAGERGWRERVRWCGEREWRVCGVGYSPYPYLIVSK